MRAIKASTGSARPRTNTARRNRNQPPSDPAKVIAAFSYFEASEMMGGEGEFVLVLDDALEKLEVAFRCQTWGDLATLAGYTWKDFVNECGDDIASFTGKRRPLRREPLDFAAIWGSDVASVIRDPRQAAYDVLIAHVPSGVWQHPCLSDLLDVGGSSPGGGLDAIATENPAGFEIFANVLHTCGFTGLTFRRVARRPYSMRRRTET